MRPRPCRCDHQILDPDSATCVKCGRTPVSIMPAMPHVENDWDDPTVRHAQALREFAEEEAG